MRFLLLSFAALLTLAGCPDDGDGGETCNDYQPPPSLDLQAPAVSFAADVMPIFARSCAFTSCHGLRGNANGVYLGNDAAAVHQALVDVRASHLPTMALVARGNPRDSFLMRKLDGSQCVLDPQCIDGDCGDSMPRREELLPIEMRDTVRRWIAQGAKND